jgi:O-acetyl-ADP-ribose deacetylase (regulator of RNase III)
MVVLKEAPSQKTGKTMLSGTEATHHHQSLDEIVDTKSVTSYAVTVTDIHGKGVNLPPPPKNADGERDFECPYCYIICPARYGRGRPWRTHLLQDLQPYICTYPECEASEQLFRSRREWHEHEAGHRKVWRCPEHPSAVYRSPSGLEAHLRQEHMDSFPESQLATVVKIGETSTVEVREKCPICFLSADAEGMGDFANHVAHHLERFAAFALPNSSEEDADGVSSAASRGRSGSTASQDVSGMSLPSDVSDEQDKDETVVTELQRGDDDPLVNKSEPSDITTRALLSLASLQSLPDVSHSRLDTLMVDRVTEQGNMDQENDEGQTEIYTADVEEQMQHMEDFRIYLMSLPGAQSVRFFKRYGSWRGHAIFDNQARAAKAVQSFDTNLYPHVKIQQGAEGSRNKLKFITPNTQETRWQGPARQLTSDTQNTETRSNASSSMVYDDPEIEDGKEPVISISGIPTLRDMYRSRKILQRDQSFAPNDAYNRLISFCYYDLTRIRVDAIVNSANKVLKVSKHANTLNYSIHKAGGPRLTEEATSKGRLKSGQATLTGGHNLPCAHVIHAARPQYGANQGMSQFNVLTECYRSALKIAKMHELKTIAFPCLGAGGCGFPPRIAARIALQEVREFLDFHQNPPFERLIFVVQSASDEKAYTDLFPVFFPPTHGDLEAARSSELSASRASLAAEVLEVRLQVQKIAEELSAELSLFVPDFPKEIVQELQGIDVAFSSIRGFLLGSKPLTRSLEDLSLLCSVVQTTCGSVTELTESAKVMPFSGGRSHKDLWDDYNNHQKMVHDHELEEFLRDCHDFAQYLEDLLARNGVELDEMAPVRLRLASFKAKQRGQNAEGARELLDEVLYTREFQRETYTVNKDIVRMHQVPSITQLYSSNSLEAKSTMIQPSAAFNDRVCFIREDITKLEVAVMVNSTDVTFAGMGTLDRKVFNKGGVEIREACTKLGVCKEGDVKATEGFGLPAKRVLHVVAPEQWTKNSKEILRQIYREILYTAQWLRATSLAIPAIGTGMLNYPRRDCAALALEEVHRFLETAEPSSSLEKIILVAYSSNDDFVYKSLLPVYFPPIDRNIERVLPVSHPFPKEKPVSPENISAPKRMLFSSIGDAVRNLGSSRSGKRPVAHTWRAINTYEEHALIGFEAHAQDCDVCKLMEQLYQDKQNLCEHGYPLAQTLLWYMNLGPDQLVYTRAVQIRQSVRLEVPEDMFPLSMTMLRLVEASLREEGREPFVSSNRAFSTIVRGELAQEDESVGPTIYNAETARASVEVWSASEQAWSPVSPSECIVFVRQGRLEVYKAHAPSTAQEPLLTILLDPAAKITKPPYRNGLVVRGARTAQFDNNEEIMLVSQSKSDSESLLAMLHRANPKFPMSREGLETTSRGRPAQGADLSLEDSRIATTISGKDIRAGLEQEQIFDSRRSRDSQDPVERSLSPLQAEMQRLSEAASRFKIGSPEQQSATITQLSDFMAPSTELKVGNMSQSGGGSLDETLTAFELQVLHHLTEDLKVRPGSYIGKSTKDIAAAFEKSLDEVRAATASLSRLDYIHNTINDVTWVISRPPANLPVLANRPGVSQTQAKPSTMRSDTEADKTDMLFQMDLLEQRILSYFSMFNHTSPLEKGCTALHVAEALDADLEEVELALDQLAEQGRMYLAPDGKTWNTPLPRQHIAPASSDQEAVTTVAEQAIIRNLSEFKDTPPSPVLPAATTETATLPTDLDLSNLDESAFYPFNPATRWTRIDASYVDSQVLANLDEEYHKDGYSLIVHRLIRRAELKDWVQKTLELRLKKGETARVRRGVSGHDWLSRDKERGEPRDDRDLHQANLDRVLAGDMKEDEIRHFRRDDEAEKR